MGAATRNATPSSLAGSRFTGIHFGGGRGLDSLLSSSDEESGTRPRPAAKLRIMETARSLGLGVGEAGLSAPTLSIMAFILRPLPGDDCCGSQFSASGRARRGGLLLLLLSLPGLRLALSRELACVRFMRRSSWSSCCRCPRAEFGRADIGGAAAAAVTSVRPGTEPPARLTHRSGAGMGATKLFSGSRALHPHRRALAPANVVVDLFSR